MLMKVYSLNEGYRTLCGELLIVHRVLVGNLVSLQICCPVLGNPKKTIG